MGSWLELGCGTSDGGKGNYCCLQKKIERGTSKVNKKLLFSLLNLGEPVLAQFFMDLLDFCCNEFNEIGLLICNARDRFEEFWSTYKVAIFRRVRTSITPIFRHSSM